MKKFGFKLLFVFALISLSLTPLGHSNDLEIDGNYNDTNVWDGGTGSTLSTADSSTDYDTQSVPDVGPSGPVGYYDQDGNYHSY